MKKPTQENLTPETYKMAIDHAIALELTTIPCYLSTYYSINRAQDQDSLYNKLLGQLNNNETLAKELTMDVLLYANKAAGFIMSVVVEEMLHLSLSSNVRQATVGPPDIMAAGKALTYPATLFAGDPNEFKINRAPLSMDQLIILLEIESPNQFQEDPTIGQFYDQIIKYVKDTDIDWQLTGDGNPQLVPTQPYYSQNTINTVYYNEAHEPQFSSADDSGGMIEVKDKGSAIAAMNEIIDQGEGHKGGDLLEFDANGRPKPLPIKDGKVVYNPEDYDDASEQELSHFAKFMGIYSLGAHFEKKFSAHEGLDPFFKYFVYDQDTNPATSDYPVKTKDGKPGILHLQSQLGNAIYTYVLLMVETCYYQELPTQYEVFMMGIHKSMMWLISQFGGDMRSQTYDKNGASYAGALTFEYYPFENDKNVSPKNQIFQLAENLIAADSSYAWLFSDTEYLPALPDVQLDHSVNKVPLTTPKTN